MTRCSWAACTTGALHQDEQGHWHCAPHWRDHLAFALEEEVPARISPSTRESVVTLVGQGYRNAAIAAMAGVTISRVNQIRREEGITDRPRIAVCGTRSGFQRHRQDSTPPCEPCALVEREYQRQYDRERRARLRAAS